MDPFGLFILISLLLLVGIFLLIGKFYPGSGAEQLDWKPTRSYEDEIRLELEDVDQMIEAQNERRRAAGRPEITEEQVRAEVELAERRRKQDSDEYRAQAANDVGGAADDDAEAARLDLEELLEMKNERRRRQGKPEITLEQFEDELARAEGLRRSGGDPGAAD